MRILTYDPAVGAADLTVEVSLPVPFYKARNLALRQSHWGASPRPAVGTDKRVRKPSSTSITLFGPPRSLGLRVPMHLTQVPRG